MKKKSVAESLHHAQRNRPSGREQSVEALISSGQEFNVVNPQQSVWDQIHKKSTVFFGN